MEVVSNAVFSNAGDEDGNVYQAGVVMLNDAFWLVATWLELPSQEELVPEWLVPLAALGYPHPVRGVFVSLGSAVPKELAGPHAEQSAMQRAGAVLNPLLALHPSGGSIH